VAHNAVAFKVNTPQVAEVLEHRVDSIRVTEVRSEGIPEVTVCGGPADFAAIVQV
jgi:hypothetical protein